MGTQELKSARPPHGANMKSAIDGEIAPARLYRQSSSLPPEVLCVFNEKDNLLIWNTHWYERLTDAERREIMRDPRTIRIRHPESEVSEGVADAA